MLKAQREKREQGANMSLGFWFHNLLLPDGSCNMPKMKKSLFSLFFAFLLHVFHTQSSCHSCRFHDHIHLSCRSSRFRVHNHTPLLIFSFSSHAHCTHLQTRNAPNARPRPPNGNARTIWRGSHANAANASPLNSQPPQHQSHQLLRLDLDLDLGLGLPLLLGLVLGLGLGLGLNLPLVLALIRGRNVSERHPDCRRLRRRISERRRPLGRRAHCANQTALAASAAIKMTTMVILCRRCRRPTGMRKIATSEIAATAISIVAIRMWHCWPSPPI